MKNLLTAFARRLRRSLASRQPSSFIEVERAEQIFYLEYLREGMTVFDVGANIGELTLLFSKFIGEDGRVHAFEASSNAFERLTNVCRAAGRRNITHHHLALADTEGTARLYVYTDEYMGWNSLALRPLEKYGINVAPIATEDVATTTIDDYCAKNSIDGIDLLKIDVEGAEFQVLLGARRMLMQRRIKCVVFEFGQTTYDMGNRPDDIEKYLAGAGYKLRNIVRGDGVFPGRESVETASYSVHVATPERT